MEIGYDTRVNYRRGIDAELIGWKTKIFNFLDMVKVDH